MDDVIEMLWLPESGKTRGPPVEPVNQVSAIEPGKYDLMCNTKAGEQFCLARNVEVLPAQQTIVRPGVSMGMVRVDPLSRKDMPRLKLVRLVPSDSYDQGRIPPSTRLVTKWGVLLPILQGKYHVLATPQVGEDFLLVKDVTIRPGTEISVKPDDEMAAIVVRPEVTMGLKIEQILILKSGTNSIKQFSAAVGAPMPVYARDAYDIILKQSRSESTLKKKVVVQPGKVVSVP